GALRGARGDVRDDGGDSARGRRRQGHPLPALPEQGPALPGPPRRADPRVPAVDDGARRGDRRGPSEEAGPLSRRARAVHGGEPRPPLWRRGAALGGDPPGALPLPRLRLAPVDRPRSAARGRARGGDRRGLRSRVPGHRAPGAAGGRPLLPPAPGGRPPARAHQRRPEVARAGQTRARRV
ncbi:MAG: Transcriptional regulator, AcrR family, partial [uncultured Rubrobacteraceae bacterium]